MTRLAALCAAEEVDIDEIASVVSFDQALSARTLKSANAASAGSLAEIGTIQAATMRLGPAWLLASAMGSCVHARMSSELPEYGLGKGELFEHAVAASLAADELRRVCKTTPPSEAPTAALLHDVGKLILSRHITPTMLLAMRERMAHENVIGIDAESEVLGLNHASCGRVIATSWGLSEPIALAIAFHHRPSQAPEECRDLANAVHVADVIAALTLNGVEREGFDFGEFAEALVGLGMPSDDLRKVCARVEEQLSEVISSYT